MKCKFCQHELEDGVTLCPNCGKENAEKETAPADETKPVITLTPGKLALVIAAVVALTAVLVALILQGAGVIDLPRAEETTVPTEITGTTEPAATEAPATTPADGNPDDVTCKGSYTVADDEVIAARETVVATLGESQLTNAELQIYYWMQVQQFLSNYGSYAVYFGLDYTQPLDTQVCALSEEGITWQQYFLDAALDCWHSYQALANESVLAGFELDEEYRAYVDGIPESLATEGGLQGFATAEEYLAYNVGPGCTLEDYMHYMEVYYQGYLYFEQEYAKLAPTDEELEAYFTEHESEYAEEGVTWDTAYVDVRHILVLPEGATLDTIYTETFSDDAWAAGEASAQEILNQWLSGEQTEDAFAALANEHSADPGSNTVGGLYEDVYEGEMMEAFNDWCFDAERKTGDYGIVRTDAGYHIMYFVGKTPVWSEYALYDIMSERGSAMVADTMAKYTLEVDYSAIALGFVDMTA